MTNPAGTLEKSAEGRSKDKRARILAAALALFEARGFDAVAVPEIARAAEVATGTIYRYFRDKTDLGNALYRHWKWIYSEAVLAPLRHERGLTPRDAFASYWHGMMLFARAHPRAMRFLDLHHHGAYLDAASKALAARYRAEEAAFIRRAQQAGAIRDLDPALVAALVWGAVAGTLKFAEDGTLKADSGTAVVLEEALWRAIAAA